MHRLMLFCLIGPKYLEAFSGEGDMVKGALMPSIWVFCINLNNKYYRKSFCPNNIPFFALISVNPEPRGVVLLRVPYPGN